MVKVRVCQALYGEFVSTVERKPECDTHMVPLVAVGLRSSLVPAARQHPRTHPVGYHRPRLSRMQILGHLKKHVMRTGTNATWGISLLRSARHPPVMKPEMIAFHASSFCRYPFIAQSNVENMPPQMPKFPPVTGARAFIDDMAPTNRSPCGCVTRQ